MERRSARIATYVAAVFVFWTVAAPSAHAYIDPGSTNFIIQILIGALAGAGLAIATFWRRIKLFFSRNKGDQDGPAGPTPPTSGAAEPTGPEPTGPPEG